MYRRTILSAFALITAIAGSSKAEIIAEYTSTSTVSLVVSNEFDHAMAFDVTGSPTVTEVQVVLGRWTGSTGYVTMELRRNAPGTLYDYWGAPESGCVAHLTAPVSEIPSNAAWISFEWPGGGTTISPGRWWIVIGVTSDSDADHISWMGVRDNPYNGGVDTVTSKDGGSTWTIIQGIDAAFRVFGTRTSENTTTTVTATPGTVTASGTSLIEVTVRDSGSNLVQGPGTVDLTKTGGTFGQSSLTLANGQASTTWTAPGSLASHTITANYTGHSFAGYDYQSSSSNTTVNMVAEQRATTTSQTLATGSTTTRSSINVSVTVRDSLNNLVNGGTMTFSCPSGGFGSKTAAVVNGQASTTWTASNSTGTFAVKASYSGFDSGTIVYGASSDSDNVSVDYTNVTTTTSVTVSPDYPYAGRYTYVTVKVTDGSGNLVPGGSANLSAPSGSFPSSTVTLAGGMGSAKWQAPSGTSGAVSISAHYQQYLAGGNRYLASSGNDTANVTQDTDSTGTNLSWMSQWISDYSSSPLPNSKDQSQGFTNKLVSDLGWAGAEYANDNACEDYMKKSSKGGRENDLMDVHDFTWYNGHGNPDYITFITDCDDDELHHSDAYDSWGTKDADWLAIKSCKVMSHDSYWASTMNGIHLECGFITNAQSSKTFGKLFAGFMIKENAYDEPHTIEQSWFLAGDMTHSTDRKQRVIAESSGMFNDYIWGQGYVSPDPAVDNFYVSHDHDIRNRQSPTADAGDPYGPVTQGAVVQLDASGSSDPDPGDYLFYAWDLDTGTNTDAGDWDVDGVDENSDDADVWGRRPQVVFPTAKTYNCRLMVIDETWKVSSDWFLIQVNPAPGSPPPGGELAASNGGSGGPEIVDDFDPASLPPGGWLPVFDLADTTIGYNEMINIAGYYGVSGPTGIDGAGNWNMVNENRELLVNQYSGSVMYFDRERAYVQSGPPLPLPEEAQAIQIAQNFVAQNDILCPDAVVESVTDMFTADGEKGSREITRVPYQRRVNFRRNMNVGGNLYPVVGPGGRITVMLDEYGDVVMFNKVCRHAYRGTEVELLGADVAVTEFHRLGSEALVGSNFLPECNRIEIENVSLAYYEDDFVTLQEALVPVYVLELTCEDDVGSQEVEVYVSAVAPPLEAAINEPSGPLTIYNDEEVYFEGEALGGTPPYTCQWESNYDGPLSGEPNFVTSSLSVCCENVSCSCANDPHVVTLTVTDAHGFTAHAAAEVDVMGACADINGDGTVNMPDFAVTASCWQTMAHEEGYDQRADYNNDNFVNMKDVCIFAGEWLQVGPALAGRWPLEEGSGATTTADTGLGGNDAAIIGDPAWVAGVQGSYALDFDGSGDYLKTADETNSLDFAPGSFSASAWVNARTATGGWKTIMEYDRYGSNWFGIWLSSDARFHFRVGGDTMNSTEVLNTGQWYLLTATYEAPTKTMKLYIDGEFDSPHAHTVGYAAPASDKLTIGVRNTEDDEYFDGKLDDLRIYNFALEADEVVR